jgi:hypothetical protein
MGLPPYVLSPTLQDGKKIPKWAHRARRGQFLDFTKNHSSMIGLLCIIQTGSSILPQFHVVFEELFSTVHSLEEDNPTWVELFTSERDYYSPDEDKEDADSISFPDIDPSWIPTTELPTVPTTHDPTIITQGDEAVSQQESIDTVRPIYDNEDVPSESEYDNPVDNLILLETLILSKRRSRRNKRVFGDEWANHTVQLTPTSRIFLGYIVPSLSHDDLFLHSLDWDARFSADYDSFHYLNLLRVDPFTDEVDWIHPFTLGAKVSSTDTPTLREIQQMSPDEVDRWYDAMDIELQALRDKQTMIEINRCDVPNGKQIVKSTWAFKRKRQPNGEIYKLKARFVVRGDLQRLDPHDSTFSPMVDWRTVRLLFILTVTQGLRSRTIDFNSAFVQSDLPERIYLELPHGYAVPNEDKVY